MKHDISDNPRPNVRMETLDRNDAIDKMIEHRIEGFDAEDIEDALRCGRIGYEEMDNDTLMELWVDCFNFEPVQIVGTEPLQTVEIPKSENAAMLAFIGLVAGMKTEEEFCLEDLPPSEDWVSMLSDLIVEARKLQKGTK